MPRFPGIHGAMDIQLLFLEETLLTGFTRIWQNPQVRLHVIVHCILLLFGYAASGTDIVTGFIPQIGHTRLGSHGGIDSINGSSL
jgi:hypothetical protein